VYIWEQKLKLTKSVIKIWGKNVSFPLHLEVLEKPKILEDIQDILEKIDVQPEILLREQVLHREYLKDLKDEETMWRLKSRSL